MNVGGSAGGRQKKRREKARADGRNRWSQLLAQLAAQRLHTTGGLGYWPEPAPKKNTCETGVNRSVILYYKKRRETDEEISFWSGSMPTLVIMTSFNFILHAGQFACTMKNGFYISQNRPTL